MKTVVVLGASYGGNRAVRILIQELPEGWRVVIIDRNTHFNHLYSLPRFAILPQHGYKAFIPYTHIFGPSAIPEVNPRHIFLHAQVTSVDLHSLTLSRSFPEHGVNESDRTLHFDYLVYALGSHLPAPIDLWGPVDPEAEKGKSQAYDGRKSSGINWLERFRGMVEAVSSVLVVGGGALGIQYATDIAEVFPQKRVTLLHSRKQLLPKFNEAMHDEIMSTFSEMNIKAVLGERLDLTAPPKTVINDKGVPERVVRTQSGKEIHAEIVLLCTGQSPNIALLQEALPESIIPEGPSKGMVRVSRTMQVAVSKSPSVDVESDPVEHFQDKLARSSVSDNVVPTGIDQPEAVEVPHPHLFAVGDVSDAFGAIKAGHTAYFQAEVAARNILKLIGHDKQLDEAAVLEKYAPGEPAIKVSLGLSQAVYQVEGVVDRKTGASEDLDAPLIWKFYGIEPTEETMRL